ncbi:MAG: DeoR/GlpR family DNA-binding transcription regulator [Oceanipulchritudo sp.]
MNFFRKYTAQGKENRWLRWRKIFDLLEDRHVVPIHEIIAETGSKSSIIEADIKTLSDRGLVKRTAKGGLILEGFHSEKSLEERSAEDQEAKLKIAKLAAEKYVTEGMTIFIDGSTTTFAMIPFFSGKKLRVVTNSLSVIAALRESQFPGEIICVGGHFRSKSNTVVGGRACDMLRSESADLTILGVEGVSSRMELMEAHPAEALIKQAMVEQGRRTIILAMPHKLNDDSLLTFATLEQVEALISTRFPDASFRKAAKALGVRLEHPLNASSAD